MSSSPAGSMRVSLHFLLMPSTRTRFLSLFNSPFISWMTCATDLRWLTLQAKPTCRQLMPMRLNNSTPSSPNVLDPLLSTPQVSISFARALSDAWKTQRSETDKKQRKIVRAIFRLLPPESNKYITPSFSSSRVGRSFIASSCDTWQMRH
ncbi:hypothetical protein EDD16DRAFT_189245 [Pisolithus croceorrhizus]|nr:hypothetical protein EDD16DRAFT_189245 [Pisolithus croceorrhizus]KAI6111270.1 hypothetical protein F5141DRAFT_1113601 [Pisolithus sp. B1]KAI6140075.1 hypothetical protein EDD17DRAFT_1713317 [Pisolithus thermaeus]